LNASHLGARSSEVDVVSGPSGRGRGNDDRKWPVGVEDARLDDHAPPVTDQRLRDLERDAAHGDLHARGRLLLERVRVGDLTQERLRLAAYLGHESVGSST
jgi:hypothetical protein